MFNKSKSVKQLTINEQEITAFIGYGYELNGKISGKSVIRIDGTVNGDIVVDGGLILGEKGMITGNIKTKVAVIFGTVNGDVNTSQLEIKSTGTVNGDIKTNTLQIELGAQYNGKLEMKQLIENGESNLKAV